MSSQNSIVEGVFYGIDDDGNQFFTAEGSPYHLAAIGGDDASQTQALPEVDQAEDPERLPRRARAPRAEDSLDS